MARLTLYALVWAAGTLGSSVSVLANPDRTAALQQVLTEYQAANPSAPGIVVHVESPRLGLDWTCAVGRADHQAGDPLTTQHTFRIASNTKTYVAAAVLRLVERGELALTDPLSRHLPTDLRELLKGDGYDLDAMTIGQVLAHTSGLFEHPADPRYEEAILGDPHHRWTRQEQIARCVEWGDPVGDPGERFSYSDTGYIILGGIIERKTGQPLGPAVRDLLDFGKLGLAATWWEIQEEQPAGAGPRAHQYYGELDTFDWDPSFDLYGGGGLVCDVRDLARFTRLLLKGKVLKRDSSLTAMTGHGTPAFRLGLMTTDFGEYLGWGHSGFWNTFVFHVPELDLTVSGCILDHFAVKGQELARELVAAVAP
jgi:D-alanyl-D-alanine carboxypeptidase